MSNTAIYCYFCNTIVSVPECPDFMVDCEDCGEHPAWKCPECKQNIDSIGFAPYLEEVMG